MSGILDLIYPPKCAGCGELTENGAILCGICSEKWRKEKAEFRRHGPFVPPRGSDTILSLTSYSKNRESVSKRMLLRAKDRKIGKLYDLLADELCTVIKNSGAEIDVITYSPRSNRKLVSQGTDQSYETAKRLSKRLGVPLVSCFLHKGNVQQKSLGNAGRNANAESSTEFRFGAKEKINGKNVLLYDDIITTGATLSAAARLLKENGAVGVVCVTAARSI